MTTQLRPCTECPFRRDCPTGWLRHGRMQQIIRDTVKGDKYFICHKTSDLPKRKRALCGGKLILEQRINPLGNRSTRMAIALRYFPGYEALRGKELIFDTAEEAVEHHK